MGGVTLNRTKDRLIDNALDRQGGYAAEDLASQGISYQQQGQLRRAYPIGNRFDAAKEMYAATGDRAYHKIARDLRSVARDHLQIEHTIRLRGTSSSVARDHLQVDGRQWRLP